MAYKSKKECLKSQEAIDCNVAGKIFLCYENGSGKCVTKEEKEKIDQAQKEGGGGLDEGETNYLVKRIAAEEKCTKDNGVWLTGESGYRCVTKEKVKECEEKCKNKTKPCPCSGADCYADLYCDCGEDCNDAPEE